MFKWLKNRAEKRQKANILYNLAANHARHPEFYQTYQVPDSITGRYELLCIHIFLLLDRLRSSESDIEISQMLTEILVKELERAYRDSGFRDLAIPKNIKRLVAGFYERASAYKSGLNANDQKELMETINRFVFTGATNVDDRSKRLAFYMVAARKALAKVMKEDIENTNFVFISPDIAV
jgi:cytochrome b pre-mRNA-processing protein 3